MVSVNTVYQTVLALANKEQRGYITPQEFNLHANHAQLDIFEQYFYDLNQFKRVPGNQSSYADMTDLIGDKIQVFKRGEDNITMDEIVKKYGRKKVLELTNKKIKDMIRVLRTEKANLSISKMNTDFHLLILKNERGHFCPPSLK